MKFIYLFFFLFTSTSAFAELPDFVGLAEKVNPAIVFISTKQIPKGPRYQDPMLEFLERYYGGGRPGGQAEPIQALGSGFIIEKNGLIITNNHVVDKADEIEVQLSDSEKKYKAKVIGKDSKTDIALIKIETKKDLPTIPFGSSDKLKVGSWVAAFGNPLGLSHSVTKGIVSAKGRVVDELGIFPFIQTDASINPGNSGGPLVNLQGEVVGVNTFIIKGANGLGFAVPIDGVKQILSELKKNGSVRRGYLGITYGPIDPRAARHLGLKTLEGAIIGDVSPGSPAAKAGLKPYDVILEFGKTKIIDAGILSNAVAKQKVGSKVKVVVWREGKQKNLYVKIKLPPESNTASSPKGKGGGKAMGINAPYDLGFHMVNLNKSRARNMKIPYIKGAAVITHVSEGSPAEAAGLMEGDIILDINRKPTKNISDVSRYLREGNNLIRVQRGDYRVALFLE